LPGKNPQKFLFLKPNPLIDVMIAQASLKKKFEHTTPPEQDTSLLGSLRTPGQHRPIMMSQGKSRGLMFIPPPGVVRNSGPHFDQALDQPVHGPLKFFAPYRKLPDHMQEVVGPWLGAWTDLVVNPRVDNLSRYSVCAIVISP
jgi:hypothetical protein